MKRVMYLDLETADAEQLYTYGPGFVRLAGYVVNDGPVQLTTDVNGLCRLIAEMDLVVGHNVIAFDLAALQHWHGLDVEALVSTDRVRDTLLMARQQWPVTKEGPGHSLEEVAKRLDLRGKLADDSGSVLKSLAAEFGGFDQIPVDHPGFRSYLRRDVQLQREVFKAMARPDRYVMREHRVMHRLQAITRHGWAVDRELVKQHLDLTLQRRDLLMRIARLQWGVPLRKANGELYAKPAATAAGRAALEAALEKMGVEVPRTDKGVLCTKRGVLEELREAHPGREDVAQFCEIVGALSGERSIWQTITDCTDAAGRVHPSVSAGQASGRISVTRPGLTVLGKRDRRNVLERAALLPDPGHVLICADLSQVDARAMAACSQDPAYMAALAPGEDLHTAVAARVFGDATRRSDAKAITHGTTYGMGAKKLAGAVGCTPYEAELMLRSFRVSYPMLESFKETLRQQVRAGGGYTTPFGRRIAVNRTAAYTQAPALMGQGTARDLMMEGVLRLPQWLADGLRGIVHDEIVVDVPAERAEEARAALKAALQFSFCPPGCAEPVSVLAEVSPAGLDWADCYREEKASWPEVARAHRMQVQCTDESCPVHQHAAPTPQL